MTTYANLVHFTPCRYNKPFEEKVGLISWLVALCQRVVYAALSRRTSGTYAVAETFTTSQTQRKVVPEPPTKC